MSDTLKTGVELIEGERNKQVRKWGTTEAHDVDHENGELVKAALFALTFDNQFKQTGFERFQDKTYQKSVIECLIIAGALIAAEIDRLQQKNF